MTGMQLPRAAGAATLRVSVTDRCNFRCAYCMPAEGVALVPRSEIPAFSEIASAVAWLVARYGVDRVKVTGGEPLVRKNVPELVAMLSEIPAVREVSMTTNGTLLACRGAGPREGRARSGERLPRHLSTPSASGR